MSDLRKTPILYLLIPVLLLTILPAICWAKSLELRLQGPTDISTLPGRVVTASFEVRYSGEKTLEFLEKVDLPEGWLTLLPSGSFRMGPGQQTIRLLPLRIPPSTKADTFDINYTVWSRTEPSIRDRKTLHITVLPIEELQMFVLSNPADLLPGTRHKLSLQVVNGGNTAHELLLRALSDEGIRVKLPNQRLSLNPGETIVVPISVTIPHDIKLDLTYIQMDALDEKNHDVVSTLHIPLHTIPTFTDIFDPNYVIPTWIDLIIAGGSNENDEFQFLWHGGGYINQKKRQYLSFSFLAPDTSDSGSLSYTDEYWVDYTDKNISVELGDQSFYLSDFAEGIGYGRGGGITYHPENQPYEAGIHYLEGRESRSNEKETGFFVSKKLSPTSGIRLNYLKKKDREDDSGGFHEDTIYSLESESSLGKDWKVEAEYAISESTQLTESSEEDAYWIRVLGYPFPSGFLTLNKLYAAPDFFGGYNDEKSWNSNLGFPLSSNLRANIQYSEYKSNLLPERTPEITEAEEEILWRTYLDWDLEHGWYISFGYDDYIFRDRLGLPDYDFTEQSYWIKVGRNMDSISWEAEIRYGNQEDHLTGTDEDLLNYRLYLHWFFARNSFFTLYGTWGDNDSMEDRYLLDNSGEWGASLTWQATRNLLFEVLYRKDNFDNDDEETSEEYSILAEYIFPSRHALRLLYQFDRYQDGDEDESYRLTYSIPVKLKLDRREDIGALEGFVFDAQNTDREPIQGAILSLAGQKTVTDAKGRFRFLDIPFGNYYLHVIPETLGTNRTTADMFPLNISITDQEIISIKVGVVNACKVSGKIFFQNAIAASKTKGPSIQDERFRNGEGVGSLLVELRKDSNVIRRLSNQDGTFQFPPVAPGNWQLTVYDHNLPSTLKLDQARFTLNLQEDREIAVTIRPIRRKVRLINFEKKLVVLTTEKTKGE